MNLSRNSIGVKLIAQFSACFCHQWELLGPTFADTRLVSIWSARIDRQFEWRDPLAGLRQPTQRIDKAHSLGGDLLPLGRCDHDQSREIVNQRVDHG